MSVRKMRAVIAVAFVLSLWTGAGWAQVLRVVGFNVESGGARPEVVDDLIAGAQGVDIWGFSEVQDQSWATAFAQAAAQGETGAFTPIRGSTGGGDRLLIVYNRDRFEVGRQGEWPHLNIEGRVRAPLVAHFRLQPAGPEFFFMVNHLYRGNEGRHERARLLNAWAREQTLPVIAVGDDNFDGDVTRGETRHDQGYDLLTAEGVFA
jgi:hypothetical protein